MDDRRSAELTELRETYAAQVAGFEALLDRIRQRDLGEAPLHLEAEGLWPHRV